MTGVMLSALLGACAAAASPRVLSLAEPGPGTRIHGPWGVFNVLARTDSLEAFLSRPRLQPDWYAARVDKLVVALEGTVSLGGTRGPVGRGELWFTPRGALQPPARALPGPTPRLVKVHAPRINGAATLDAPPLGRPRRLSWRPAAAACASEPAALCRRALASGDSLSASLLRVVGAATLAAEPDRERLLILLEGALSVETDGRTQKAAGDAVLLVPRGESIRLSAHQPAVLIEASARAR